MKFIIIMVSVFILISFHQLQAKELKYKTINNNGEYVVLLHGIARTAKSMEPFAKLLAKNGYNIINYDYESRKYNLDELADQLNIYLADRVESKHKINFVGFSAGGIVARRFLTKYQNNYNVGKVIQVASPNHGSEYANFVSNNYVLRKFYGPLIDQLTIEKMAKFNQENKVNYNLTIIAGNYSFNPLSSMIINDNHDGTVSINSTKITGMKKHIVIDASHLFFCSNQEAREQALSYLLNDDFINNK